MFLDESGDHSLSKIDPQYPIFVLAGVIVDQEYAEGEMAKRVRQFKLDFFGYDNIILHTADITRNRNGFEQLQRSAFRETFYKKLNELMKTLEYKIVACAIKKDAHLAQYGVAALDPYMMSLDILVERFCFEIGSKTGQGVIVAEKRNPTLDHELDLAWLNLKIQGTRHIQANVIEQRIVTLTARDKNEKLAGLEIADLVATPIGRFVLGKSVKDDFRIVESKFRRDDKGSYIDTGLVVLPKK